MKDAMTRRDFVRLGLAGAAVGLLPSQPVVAWDGEPTQTVTPRRKKTTEKDERERKARCRKNQRALRTAEDQLKKKTDLRGKLREQRKSAKFDADVADRKLKQTQRNKRATEREMKALQKKPAGSTDASGFTVADYKKLLRQYDRDIARDAARSAKADAKVSDLTARIRDCSDRIRELRLQIIRLKRELTRDKC